MGCCGVTYEDEVEVKITDYIRTLKNPENTKKRILQEIREDLKRRANTVNRYYYPYRNEDVDETVNFYKTFISMKLKGFIEFYDIKKVEEKIEPIKKEENNKDKDSIDSEEESQKDKKENNNKINLKKKEPTKLNNNINNNISSKEKEKNEVEICINNKNEIKITENNINQSIEMDMVNQREEEENENNIKIEEENKKEEAKKEDEEKKRAEEEEIRRKQEDFKKAMEKRKKEEEEEARKKQEEEERRKIEEEERRKKAEEEEKRKAEEEEKRRKDEEEEKRRKIEEEERRKKAEEEEKRKAEEEEKRRKAEEDEKRKAEDEEKRKAEEEEERRKAEEEERRKAKEEEEKRKAEEEEKRRKIEDEEKRKKQEEEEKRRKIVEEEKRRKAEEEETKRKEEEDARKKVEEAKKKAEDEAIRNAEEDEKKAMEEAKKEEEDIDLTKEDNIEVVSYCEENLNLENLREIELNEHNYFRSLHGVPPLKLNNRLNDIAQKYAIYLAKNKKFEHSKKEDRALDGKYVGENLYMKESSPKVYYICGVMSKSWYEEIKDYNYEIGKVTDENGHFTQLIWKDSREVGFGVAFNGNSVYTVANYFPGGNLNLKNTHKEQILPPLPKKEKSCKDLFNLESAKQRELKIINLIRHKNNITDLELDENLSNYALRFAEESAKTGETKSTKEINGKMHSVSSTELMLRRDVVYKGGEGVKKIYISGNKKDAEIFYTLMKEALIAKKYKKVGFGYYFENETLLHVFAVFDDF